ncbi:MAG: 30S ribosomal protein S17e [Euryarchaeota archaeon]|nr:30S ribosomal protein S17e [Euryarchaeota archaeon]
MGRVRQKDIKRTAVELYTRHRDKFGKDFKENRDRLSEVVRVQGKFMRNRIAGYITTLAKKG